MSNPKFVVSAQEVFLKVDCDCEYITGYVCIYYRPRRIPKRATHAAANRFATHTAAGRSSASPPKA